MQQIVSSIKIRKTNENRKSRNEMTWAVRSIAQFIVAGYMTEDNSEAMKAASRLTLDEIEREVQESGLLDEVEAPAEPRAGSYEKLIGAFSQTM